MADVEMETLLRWINVATFLKEKPYQTNEFFVNKTSFDLYYDIESKQVTTQSYIPKNTYLGTIEGRLCYVDDQSLLNYEKLIPIEDDIVIDISVGNDEKPNIITLLRDGFYNGLRVNCAIKCTQEYVTGNTIVGIITTEDIYPGTELAI
jgi:hypothetical protein